MRTTELTVREGEGTFKVEQRPNYPVNPLTAKQKFYLLMALILSVPFTAALFLVGRAAIVGAVVMLLIFWGYKRL